MDKETILQVGAEGGSLSILRYREPGGEWRFLVYRNESLMVDFLEEADQVQLEDTSGAVAFFPDALKILGKYPWFMLYPLVMHREYEAIVLAEVARLGGEHALESWLERFHSRHS